MGEDEKDVERIREEVDPRSEDPAIAEVEPAAREGQLVGKADAAAGRAAQHFVGGKQPAAQEGGLEAPTGAAPSQSGRGETITLESDAEHRIRAGDELVVKLPGDGGDGWSYDVVDGDERCLDIHERAQLVLHGEGQRRAPAAGSAFQFVIHGTRRGRATLRFEPAGGASDGERIRLRLEVR